MLFCGGFFRRAGTHIGVLGCTSSPSRRGEQRHPISLSADGIVPAGNRGCSRRSSAATPPERGFPRNIPPRRGVAEDAPGHRMLWHPCQGAAQSGASGSGGVADARPPATSSDASGIGARHAIQAPRNSSATQFERRATQATDPPPRMLKAALFFGAVPRRADPGWNRLGLWPHQRHSQIGLN